jgi:hypothetical protein
MGQSRRMQESAKGDTNGAHTIQHGWRKWNPCMAKRLTSHRQAAIGSSLRLCVFASLREIRFPRPSIPAANTDVTTKPDSTWVLLPPTAAVEIRPRLAMTRRHHLVAQRTARLAKLVVAAPAQIAFHERCVADVRAAAAIEGVSFHDAFLDGKV